MAKLASVTPADVDAVIHAGDEAMLLPQEEVEPTVSCGQQFKACCCPQAPKESAKVWLRRLVRVMCLLLTMGFVGMILVLVGYTGTIAETYTLKGDGLKVTVRDCYIFLERDDSVQANQIEVHVRVPFNSSSVDDSSTSLKVRNPSPEFEVCILKLKSNTDFPPLKIECENRCWIEQKEDVLNFQGTFEVSSVSDDNNAIGEGRLKLKTISAEEIKLDFYGTVTIEDLTTSNGGEIYVKDGDMWIQTQQDAYVDWITDESAAYCFAASDVVTDTQVSCFESLVEITNTTSVVINNCNGANTLCSGACAKAEVSYSAYTLNGNIWFTVLKDGSLPSNYETVYGDTVYDINIEALREVYKLKQEVLDDDLEKDVMVVMDWPGLNEEEGKWLYTTKISYAQTKPWVLGSFSFNLLIPEVRRFNTRLVPYKCPYTVSDVSDNALGNMWSTLYNTIGRDATGKVLWMEYDEVEDNWYDIVENQGGSFTLQEVTLNDNLAMLLAIVLSLLIASICGLGCAYGVYYGLMKASDGIYSQNEHERRYNLTKQTVRERNSEDAKAEQAILMAEQDEEEEEEGSDIYGDNWASDEVFEPLPGAGKLPAPFQLPDLLLTNSRKKASHSLLLFLKLICEPIKLEDDVPPQIFRLTEVKDKYEMFCFLCGYKERPLKAEKELIYSHDIEFITLNDSSTEVFRRIRFKSKRELTEQGQLHQLPNEDSLTFFVRVRCKTTAFNADLTAMKDFQIEYEKFARAEKVSDPVPITKRAMSAMGVTFERLQIGAIKVFGRYRLNLNKVEEHISTPPTDPLPSKWLCYDLITVVVHFFLVAWMLLPLTLPALLQQTNHYKISAHEYDDIYITNAELAYDWETAAYKLNDAPFYQRVLFILTLVCFGIGVLELVTYYLTVTLPLLPENIFASKTLLRRGIQYLFYLAFFFMVGCCGGLIALGLCWYILAAILNSAVFLPFAVGAATIIFFIFIQAKLIRYLSAEIFKKVSELVSENLRDMMVETVNSIVENLDKESENKAQLSRDEQRALVLFAKTPLGDVARKLGIDPKLSVALVNSDPEAIAKVAAMFGTRVEILSAIIAVVREDLKTLTALAGQISQYPGVHADTQICQMLVQLAWKQSDVNVRTAVKTAAAEYVRLKKSPLMFNEPKAYNVDPRIINAIVAMTRGSVTSLIRQMRKSKNVPDSLTDMFELISQLMQGDFTHTEHFVMMLQKYLDIPSEVAQGLGALTSDTYAAINSNRDGGVDSLLQGLTEALSLDDGVPVQIMTPMSRGQIGYIVTMLPQLIEYMNAKFRWQLDRKLIASIMATIHGVDMEVRALAETFSIDPDLGQCLACIFSEKRYSELYRDNSETDASLTPRPNSDLFVADLKPMNSDRAKAQFVNPAPSAKAFAEANQPSAESFEWMAKHYKMNGSQLLGFYAVLRGANKYYTEAVRDLTKEVLRRMRVDESFTDFVAAASIWLVSTDLASIAKAQDRLKMQCKQLTLISKQLLDPKDLDSSYLISHCGFPKSDPLVTRAAVLSWRREPELCKEWCKAAAVKAMELKKIPMRKRIMIRGQLMLAVQYPTLYLKRLFEKKVHADDDAQRKYKAVFGAFLMKTMSKARRKPLLVDLSRVLEVTLENASAFVDMVTEDSLEPKLMGMTRLLRSLGSEEATVKGSERFLRSFTEQCSLMFEAVLGYNALKEVFGLPREFFTSLTPSFYGYLRSDAGIFSEYLNSFLEELGVKNADLSRSIVSFIGGSLEGSERLALGLGIEPSSIKKILELIGKVPQLQMIDSVKSLVEHIRLNRVVCSSAQALVAYLSGINKRFDVANELSPSGKASAADIIEKLTGVPSLIVAGMISCKQQNHEEMKGIIVELARSRTNGFRIEESYCRGFISMAMGQVSNVEDISNALKFNPDIAEVLVLVSGNYLLNHTALKTSGSFQKVALRLGLDSVKMAGLIALTRGDIEHAAEIAQDLDENASVPVELLQALLAVYAYSTPDKTIPAYYKPQKKNALILKHMPWLAKMYGISQKIIASVVVRLAQGDASLLSKVYSKLGWSGTQRNYYAALCCLVNQVGLSEAAPKDFPFSWMCYKNLRQVVENLSSLLNFDEKTLEILIKASRQMPTGLNWVKFKLALPSNKDVTRLFEDIISDGNAEFIDDDMEVDFEDDASSYSGGATDINSSIAGSDARSAFGESATDFTELAAKQHQASLKTFEKFVTLLNNSRNKKHRRLYTTESVKLIISLSRGSLEMVDLLEQEVMLAHEVSPVSMIAVRELLALSVCDIKYLKAIEERYSLPYSLDKTELSLADKERLEESLLYKFSLTPSSCEVEFLLRLANADNRCWKVTADTGLNMSLRIHSNLELLQGLSSICSKSPSGVIQTIDAVADFCDLETEMALVMMMISLASIDQLSTGLVPLATRLEIDPNIAAGFVPACYHSFDALENSIQAICERLTNPATNSRLVASIIQAMKCDFHAWTTLGLCCMNLLRHPDRDEMDEVVVMRTLSVMIQEKWEVNLDSELFNAGEALSFESGLVSPTFEAEGIELPAFSGKEKPKARIARLLRFNSAMSSKVMKNIVRSEYHDDIPSIFLDIIIGIGFNYTDTIEPLLMLYGLSANDGVIIRALTSIFNENNSVLFANTECIEDHITASRCEMPPGAFQTILGSVREINLVMSKGVSRNAKLMQKQPGTWADNYTDSISSIYYSLTQKRLDNDYTRYLNDLAPIVTKMTQCHLDPQTPSVKMLFMVLMGETKEYIEFAAQDTGVPLKCYEDLLQMTIKGNPYNYFKFDWLAAKLTQMFPKISQYAMNAMLCLMSGKIEDLDYGRDGMGSALYAFMREIVVKLPPSQKIVELKPEDLRLVTESDSKEPPEIKVLDSFFWSKTDPSKYIIDILGTVPNLGRSLLPDVKTDTLVFLTGLSALFHSEKQDELAEMAFGYMSEALDIHPIIIKGFISLAQGNWDRFDEFANRQCEFNAERITQFVQLLKRLKLLVEADDDNAQVSDSYDLRLLKEKIDEGGDVEHIFHLLDTDCSGSLDYEEFIEVLKFYDVRFTEHRMIEIFSKYDVDGSCEMNLQEFEQAIEYIKQQITQQAIDDLEVDMSQLINALIISIIILLLFFAFIFAGIIGFTVGNQFGSVVTSSIPMSSGVLISKMRNPGNLQSKLGEVGERIALAINIFTINEL